MRVLILLLWILVSLFLSPASLTVNREEALPRLLMKAAESIVDPGFTMDYEAQMMAKEENLEITGGLGADSIRGQMLENGDSSGNGKETGEAPESTAGETESSEETTSESQAGNNSVTARLFLPARRFPPRCWRKTFIPRSS